MANSSSRAHKVSRCGLQASAWVGLPALAALTIDGCNAGARSANNDEVGVSEQAMHNESTCSIINLGVRGAWAAANSAYGHWCGGNIWGQEGPPVNCWDEACRKHDYAFHGPDPTANEKKSCHEVLNASVGNPGPLPGLVPDTACIDAADDVLCAEWTQCTHQAAAARLPSNGGWHWVGAGRTIGDGPPQPIRRCDDPQAGDQGFPKRCHWYEHHISAYFPSSDVPDDKQVWTCGACQVASPVPPPSLPNPKCAVSSYLPDYLQVRECCQDYTTQERASTCDCPDEQPLRREGSYSVTCLACPAEKPTWNGSPGPCVEAYPDNAIPGSVVCCECAPGTVECNGQCVNDSCSGGKNFDPTTCTCECPTGTVECGGQCVSDSCEGGQVFSPTTCSCECPAGTSWDSTAQECRPTARGQFVFMTNYNYPNNGPGQVSIEPSFSVGSSGWGINLASSASDASLESSLALTAQNCSGCSTGAGAHISVYVAGPPGTDYRIDYEWNETVSVDVTGANNEGKAFIYYAFQNLTSWLTPLDSTTSETKTASGNASDVGTTSGPTITIDGSLYSFARTYHLNGLVDTSSLCNTSVCASASTTCSVSLSVLPP